MLQQTPLFFPYDRKENMSKTWKILYYFKKSTQKTFHFTNKLISGLGDFWAATCCAIMLNSNKFARLLICTYAAVSSSQVLHASLGVSLPIVSPTVKSAFWLSEIFLGGGVHWWIVNQPAGEQSLTRQQLSAASPCRIGERRGGGWETTVA